MRRWSYIARIFSCSGSYQLQPHFSLKIFPVIPIGKAKTLDEFANLAGAGPAQTVGHGAMWGWSVHGEVFNPRRSLIKNPREWGLKQQNCAYHGIEHDMTNQWKIIGKNGWCSSRVWLPEAIPSLTNKNGDSTNKNCEYMVPAKTWNQNGNLTPGTKLNLNGAKKNMMWENMVERQFFLLPNLATHLTSLNYI